MVAVLNTWLRHGCLIVGVFIVGVHCPNRLAFAQTIRARAVLIRLIDEVEVPARSTGAIASIAVQEGQTVEAGQRMGLIDDTESKLERDRAAIELEIATKEANDDVAVRTAIKSVEFHQADYARLQRANRAQPRSVSASELERAGLDVRKAQYELEKSQSELALAKLRLKLVRNRLDVAERLVEVQNIPAPQSGVVVSVLRQPGEWVQPGETLIRIVRTDRLRAEGFVKASDVTQDLRGKQVTLTAETSGVVGGPKTELYGKVIFVSPEIDPVNDEVRIMAEIENPDGALRPGLKAEMTIGLQR